MFALRGGTALNKLFVQPPSRYSEDIDLVQAKAGAIGNALNAIRRRLDPWAPGPHECNVTINSSAGLGVFTVYVNVVPGVP